MQSCKRFLRGLSSRIEIVSQSEKRRWSNVLKQAEKAVGFSSSDANFRKMLTEQDGRIIHYLEKYSVRLDTNHDLFKTVTDLFSKKDQPTFSLIVLLVSKATNGKDTELLRGQEVVAKLSELIRASYMFHKSLINFDQEDDRASVWAVGNKLALLSGDYLLSETLVELARLRNGKVHEIISSIIRDLSDAEFMGLRDDQNRPIPSKPRAQQHNIAIPLELGVTPYGLKDVLGNMRSEWILRSVLSGGDLLGKCCQCASILANHDEAMQKMVYKFGRNVALAWQAKLELDLIRNGAFSLISAPVLLHLEDDPEYYHNFESTEIDYESVRKRVLKGPGLQKTRLLQKEFADEALSVLKGLPESDSKKSLVDIVNTTCI